MKAKRVRYLYVERKKRGWTREYLAQMVGICPASVANIETNYCDPSYKSLVMFETIFGMGRLHLMEVIPIEKANQLIESSKKESDYENKLSDKYTLLPGLLHVRKI